MAHFKKYRSFKCLGAGELCITFHNYNTNKEQKLERRLFSLGELIFALDSKYVRYKQRKTVYLIQFY